MSSAASSLLPEVFRATHLTNRKDLEKMEEIRAEVEASGGQMVREDGSPVEVPDVQERWVDEQSQKLYVS